MRFAVTQLGATRDEHSLFVNTLNSLNVVTVAMTRARRAARRPVPNVFAYDLLFHEAYAIMSATQGDRRRFLTRHVRWRLGEAAGGKACRYAESHGKGTLTPNPGSSA